MHAVVAYDTHRGIGRGGGIPWDEPEDRRRFSVLTRGAVVVYGRATWESLPARYRPLPGRANVVLSRTCSAPDAAPAAPPRDDTPTAWVATVEEALAAAGRFAADRGAATRVFVVGGASVYKEFLRRGLVATVHATAVDTDAGCDRFFPELGPWFRCEASLRSETARGLLYNTYAAAGNAGEQQYLALVRRVIETGVRRADRTGVGTRSVFGAQLRFDLANWTVPLLTTKKVFWRGIVEELLWFLRGDTDTRNLAARGVRFWDANATREFLDARGLHGCPTGHIGPAYGWQWRRFGAPYAPRGNDDDDDATPTATAAREEDAGGTHADQVKRVIELLRRDPCTRRAVISAWNPNQVDQMALPPCHVLYQFWTAPPARAGRKRRLHCAVYQRSGDLGLGVPFNVASAALLAHLVARATDTRAVELVHFVADAHVYETHVGPLRRQVRRVPRPFPRVALATDAPRTDIWLTRPDHVALRDYYPCLPTIKMPMAV